MPFGPSARRTFGVDEVLRLGAAGGDDDQHVGGLGEADEGRIVGIGHVRLAGAAVIEDLDVEGGDAPGDRLADPAEADDADACARAGSRRAGSCASSQRPARR